MGAGRTMCVAAVGHLCFLAAYISVGSGLYLATPRTGRKRGWFYIQASLSISQTTVVIRGVGQWYIYFRWKKKWKRDHEFGIFVVVVCCRGERLQGHSSEPERWSCSLSVPWQYLKALGCNLVLVLGESLVPAAVG